MKKEYRELRRRPLLTPIWLAAFFGLAFAVAVAWFIADMTTTTVVVVRHAEKEFSTIEDPPLSSVGEQRAQALARMFGGRTGPGRLEAVFSSDTRRTQSTAAPLAQRLDLPVIVVEDEDALRERIRREYRGRHVLVVGHSSTVPRIVERLSGMEDIPPMSEEDYATVYVVSVPSFGRAAVLRMSY
jgi:broad specificity phosphatase PhoE